MNQLIAVGREPVTEAPARFTAEEFMAVAETGLFGRMPGKIELVDGVIVRMAPAHIPHWTMQQRVNERLIKAVEDKRGEVAVGTRPTVRLATDTMREPDVAMLRLTGPSAGFFDGSTLLLAIEISDSSIKIDLDAKRLTYAEAGVPHYWVVDLTGRKTHVMSRPSGGDYELRNVIPFGEPLPVPGTDRTIVID